MSGLNAMLWKLHAVPQVDCMLFLKWYEGTMLPLDLFWYISCKNSA